LRACSGVRRFQEPPGVSALLPVSVFVASRRAKPGSGGLHVLSESVDHDRQR